MRFASAYRQAPRDDGADGDGSGDGSDSVRAKVRRRMDALAKVWKDADGLQTLSAPRPGNPETDGPMMVEAQADGTTRKATLTPEMLRQYKQAAKPSAA